MMTKSKIYYDHSTKQAIGFEKPLYLKKVRESKPKLYDGNVILKMDAIVISDSDETLMLCEESRLKMLLKEQDPMVLKDNAVEQHHLESRTFEVKMNQILSENEQILAQAIDHDIVKTVVNLSVNDGCKTVNECQKCLELKTELLNKKDVVDKETYDKLYQNALSFTQLFELSELRAQSQEKDTVIVKLKEQIKSLKGNVDDSKVKMDMDEIETLNIELEHRVTKLVAENEHLKQTYKQLYDSIKPKCVQSKEQCDALIKQVNIKSGEISDLNAKLQEQGLVIAALKNKLRKLKGKAVDKEAIETHSVDPNVSKDNMEPITPKLLNKRTAHSSYIKHTQERLVSNPHSSTPFVPPSRSDWDLLFQPMFDESLNPSPYVDLQAPEVIAPIPEIVAPEHAVSTGSPSSTTVDQDAPSSSNSHTTQETQTPIISHDAKEDNQDIEVAHMGNDPYFGISIPEDASVEPKNYKDALTQACWIEAMQEELHEFERLEKSKSKMRKSKKDIWKPTGKVFTKIGYIWRPTGRTFTIVGNACPLTRITTTNEVPSRKPIVLESESPKPVVKLVYSRKPRKNKNTESVSKTKVIKPMSANKQEPSKSWGSTKTNIPSTSLNECRLSKSSSGI
ncbi:hypothetical protein Tco_0683226 [Tanacetum coccineum]|uniref:Gag-Pol polyprotein n=1 Tax=Tanacetum coccineum TaxID=301880 RepID=A0ABQ4XUB1_9ASTR